MIVSYFPQIAPGIGSIHGDIMLREVNTEEEAFAQMRRFLEVNNHISNCTTVFKKPNGKSVIMSYGNSGDSLRFCIYYEGQPTHLTLAPEEKYEIDRNRLPSSNFAYRYVASLRKFICWYDEVKEYLRDLDERKVGGD